MLHVIFSFFLFLKAAARKSSIPVIPENETSDLSTANR